MIAKITEAKQITNVGTPLVTAECYSNEHDGGLLCNVTLVATVINVASKNKVAIHLMSKTTTQQ